MLYYILLTTVVVLQVAFSKHYQTHDIVKIIANTVGPYNNPTETYPVRYFYFIIFEHIYYKFIISIVLFTAIL